VHRLGGRCGAVAPEKALVLDESLHQLPQMGVLHGRDPLPELGNHLGRVPLRDRQEVGQVDPAFFDTAQFLNHQLHFSQVNAGLPLDLDEIILFEQGGKFVDPVPDPTLHFAGAVHQLDSHVGFAVLGHGHYFFPNQEKAVDPVPLPDLLNENFFHLLIPFAALAAISSAAFRPSSAALMIPPA
jgi:hypothetical protein